ncbi:MAG: hypothetical protein AVO33_06100 [delta proteobacterium ML8_F1]|nr:MAG: hypothetical protein AVO33_06100 [delta proteobacterium ML8_F1]
MVPHLSPQIIWTVLMVFFVIAEIISLGLTSIWFAFGALAALVSAYFTDVLMVQVIVFVLASVLSLFFTKPLVKRHLHVGEEKTNIDGFIGLTGVVTKAITTHETGQIKVNGQIWTAYSEEEIPPGATVTVESVSGVRLKVKKG